MSPILFAKAISEGLPLKVFNYGKHRRDFTYIDDIVQGVSLTLDLVPSPNNQWSGVSPDPSSSKAPWRIYNIGNSQPVELLDYIQHLEKAIGKSANKELLPIQLGDVENTYADVSSLMRDTGYRPSTRIEQGVSNFIKWYKVYYG
jgi:UDP-glucuronate 4-epimerase